MHDVNEVVLDPMNYEDKDDMWYCALDLLKALTKNGYISVVKEDDFGLLNISFESEDRDFGSYYPFWLSPQEAERLVYDDELAKKAEQELLF